MSNPEVSLTQEDHDAIKAILVSELESSNLNPLLPMDVDVDGDGIVDSFGLDEQGNLVVVRGVELSETVYESDGDDIVVPEGQTVEVPEPDLENEVPEFDDLTDPPLTDENFVPSPDLKEEIPQFDNTNEVEVKE